MPVVALDGRLAGIVTHRDVLAASISSLDHVSERDRVALVGWARVADVMETHLSTTDPDEPAAAAGERMIRHKIGALPVVDPDGRLVGIVTSEDYLRWATERMAAAG